MRKTEINCDICGSIIEDGIYMKKDRYMVIVRKKNKNILFKNTYAYEKDLDLCPKCIKNIANNVISWEKYKEETNGS